MSKRRSSTSIAGRFGVVIVAVIAFIAYLYSGDVFGDLGGLPSADGPEVSLSPSKIDSVEAARELLAQLGVQDVQNADSYQRELFGQRWADVDHNGCDTRNDILARDLTEVEYREGSGCVIVAGTLDDPYTGETVIFAKADASKVQIDHLVALADAWRTGAFAWDDETREEFANDPDNLLAVDGSANQSKQDKDASQWLPVNTGFQCDYVAAQISVKVDYGLWATPAEYEAFDHALSVCGV
ncbi:HNH endonuclease family protein [Propionimicrobium sp. PCR01-08-3]|uniref:HNH endonuclease family protein n=1 Tax=Propionimicrobium sp. PCR01-08-3 TaxID=3052086 RepID=UPI00255CE9D8|nr:HNH endonuclease family protein [Propionimicrobium sp. PCR01-08-3]WIY81967.1 HNH endonuclease family protein [Propionimicrobium sp. PCR01-08-3]